MLYKLLVDNLFIIKLYLSNNKSNDLNVIYYLAHKTYGRGNLLVYIRYNNF